jgi:hypothetical protein
MTLLEVPFNLFFYARAFIFFIILRIATPSPLPLVVPEMETNLKMTPYSEIVPTTKSLNTFLVTPLPKGEEDSTFKKIIAYIVRLVAKTFFQSLDQSISLHSDQECRETFMTYIMPFIRGASPPPSFDSTLLDYNNSVINGTFYGNLKFSGESFVIDSTYMQKYQFKSGLIPPIMKATFKQVNKSLILDSIYHSGKMFNSGSAGFDLGRRILNSYLLIDTMVNKHLVVSHFKVAQTGAFAVRKFLSSNNRIKQFLFNFSFGVISVNHGTDSLIGKDYGSLIKSLPFTEESLIDYINDCISENHTTTLFPSNDQAIANEHVSSGILGDCVKIFEVYKKSIKDVLRHASEEENSECQQLLDYLQCNIKEYQNCEPEDILASYMYVTSVVHELKQAIYNYITQAYSFPQSLNHDGSVPKYIYLSAMLSTLLTIVPMRTLFIDLPDSYHPDTKFQYYKMLSELKNLNLGFIKIEDIDSSVQV